MICAWMDTSSAEIGSSATMKSGLAARARAMPMRCCWPPGEFVRVALDVPRAQSDRGHQLAHAFPLLRARVQAERFDRLGDDFADGHPRVERRVRVLEDHLEVAALLDAARAPTGAPDPCLGRSLRRPSARRAAGPRARASTCRSPIRRPGPWFRPARMSRSTPSTACTTRRTRLPPVSRSHAVPPPRSKWTFRSRMDSSGGGYRRAQASGSGLARAQARSPSQA